jgi:hypothetical protein
MHVFHTAGVPPSTGKSIFAIIGSTANSNAALTKIVAAKSNVRELILDPIVLTDTLELSGDSLKLVMWWIFGVVPQGARQVSGLNTTKRQGAFGELFRLLGAQASSPAG